jgi:hypothetical protein
LRVAFCTSGIVDYKDYKGKNLLGTESKVFGLANVASPNLSDMLIQKVITSVRADKVLKEVLLT